MKNIIFYLLIYYSLIANWNLNQFSIPLKISIQDTIPAFYKKSNAYKYLDFTNDSSLFNSFIARVDSIKIPKKIETHMFEDDSLVFMKSGYGKSFSKRTISAIPEFKNELTPLFKFFRNISYGTYSGERFNIYGPVPHDKRPHTDSSVSVIYVLKNNFNNFHLLLLIAHKTAEIPSTFLCTFSSSGNLIDCLNIGQDEFKGGTGGSSTFYNTKTRKFFQKNCDIMLTGQSQYKKDCDSLTFELNPKGKFILLKKSSKVEIIDY